MQGSSEKLIEELKKGRVNQVTNAFKKFSDDFGASVTADSSKAFRLFSKSNSFETGIATFSTLIHDSIFASLNHQNIRQIVKPLFDVLLHPYISSNIHRESFKKFLEMLSAIAPNADDTDYQTYSTILVVGCFMFNFADPDSIAHNSIYNKDVPYRPDKNKNDEFTKELFKILINYIEVSGKFMFFWKLLSTSILPIIFNMPTKLFTLQRSPPFDFQSFFNLITHFLSINQTLVEAFAFAAPGVLLRLISYSLSIYANQITQINLKSSSNINSLSLSAGSTGSNQSISSSYSGSSHSQTQISNSSNTSSLVSNNDFIAFDMLEIFLPILSDILLNAAKTDFQAISQFYQGVFLGFKSYFHEANFDAKKDLDFNQTMDAWDFFIQKGTSEELNLIPNILTDIESWIKQNPSYFSLYCYLLLLYKSKKEFGKNMIDYFKEMNSLMLSAACEFFCVLAIIFAPQLLGLSPEVLSQITNPKIVNDCGNFFLELRREHPESFSLVNHFLNHIEIQPLVSRINHKMNTTSSPKEINDYISSLFSNILGNHGLYAIYSAFLETLITLAKIIPLSTGISLNSIFSNYLTDLLPKPDIPDEHSLIISFVHLTVDILSLRSFALHLPFSFASKLSISILRFISSKDNNVRQKAIDLSVRLIVSGNPGFLPIIPYWLTEELSQTTVLSPLSSSGIVSLVALTTITELNITTPNIPLEASVAGLLTIDQAVGRFTESAQRYFFNSKKLFSTQKEVHPQITKRTSPIDVLSQRSINSNSSYLLDSSIITSFVILISDPNSNFLDSQKLLLIISSNEFISRLSPSILDELSSIIPFIPSYIRAHGETIKDFLALAKILFERFKSNFKSCVQIYNNNVPKTFFNELCCLTTAFDIYSKIESVKNFRYPEFEQFINDLYLLQIQTPNKNEQICKELPSNVQNYNVKCPSNLYNKWISSFINRHLLHSFLDKEQRLPDFEVSISYPIAFSSDTVMQMIHSTKDRVVLISKQPGTKSIYSYNTSEYHKTIEEEPELPIENLESTEPESKDESKERMFFSSVVKEINKRKLNQLLATPEKLASCKEENTNPNSCSDYSNIFKSNNYESNIPVHAAGDVLCALSSLTLFGNSNTEHMSKFNTNLNKILHSDIIQYIDAPVIFIPNSKNDSRFLFNQFIKALGVPLKNEENHILFSDWENRILFKVGTKEDLCSKSSIRIFWCENPDISEVDIKGSSNLEIPAPNTLDIKSAYTGFHTVDIWLRPLNLGVVHTSILTSRPEEENEKWGPLRNEMLITCEVLPVLLRKTIEKIYRVLVIPQSTGDKIISEIKSIVSCKNDMKTSF